MFQMQIRNKLDGFGLDTTNSIVIGSGILNALNIQKNKDIDLVVTEKKYEEFFKNSHFKIKEIHGRNLLTDNLFEIGIDWNVLDKNWKFDDLVDHSVVLNNVRYNTIEFLLNAKRHWLSNGFIRQKDIDDVKLMEDFLST